MCLIQVLALGAMMIQIVIMCMTNGFCTFLVWPSKYAKLSLFRELINTHSFEPKHGMTVKWRLCNGHSNHDIPIVIVR